MLGVKGFQPGNKLNARRVHRVGGRPKALITQIRDEIALHPQRATLLMNKLYSMALAGDKDCIRDYLDRIGYRMPKESINTIQGMISIGAPEDYRRAAELMLLDKQAEAKLLPPVLGSLVDNLLESGSTNTSTSTNTPLDKTL